MTATPARSVLILANDTAPHVLAQLGEDLNDLDLDVRFRFTERYHHMPEHERRKVWCELAQLMKVAEPIEGQVGAYRIGLKLALPSIHEIAAAFLRQS